MAAKLQDFRAKTGILLNTQFGSRIGHSTNDALTTVCQYMQENLMDTRKAGKIKGGKRRGTLALADMSGAFNSVQIPKAISMVTHYGMLKYTTRWAQSVLTKHTIPMPSTSEKVKYGDMRWAHHESRPPNSSFLCSMLMLRCWQQPRQRWMREVPLAWTTQQSCRDPETQRAKSPHRTTSAQTSRNR